MTILKKILRRFSEFCFRKAGFPPCAQQAMFVSVNPALIAAGGSILGGLFGSRSAGKASRQAARSAREAAELERQTAREALEFAREQYGYGKEQDLYNRALQERNFGTGHAAYRDQYRAAQLSQEQQRQQLNYENQLRQHAMGGLNEYANLGLGSIGALPTMVNATPNVASNLYGLAGMQAREATPIPAFDHSATRPYDVQAPGMTEALGPSQMPAYQDMNIDVLDEYVQEQLKERAARTEAENAKTPSDPKALESDLSFRFNRRANEQQKESLNSISRMLINKVSSGEMTMEEAQEIMDRHRSRFAAFLA